MLLPGKTGKFPVRKMHRKEKSPRIRRLTCVYYSNFLSICKHENRKFAYYFAYNLPKTKVSNCLFLDFLLKKETEALQKSASVLLIFLQVRISFPVCFYTPGFGAIVGALPESTAVGAFPELLPPELLLPESAAVGWDTCCWDAAVGLSAAVVGSAVV